MSVLDELIYYYIFSSKTKSAFVTLAAFTDDTGGTVD